MAALVRGDEAEVVLGRAVHARAQAAAVIEGGIVEVVEEGEHLAMGSFELGPQPARPSRPPTRTGSKDWATTPSTRSEARGGVVGEGCAVGTGVAVDSRATGVRCERALRSFETSMT